MEKRSQLHVYRRLSSFFGDAFPDIELASERDKDLLIKELATSYNFDKTHSTISELSRFSDFTPAQVNEIVGAAVTNNQVYWIAHDGDVRGFLTRVIRGREKQVDLDNLRRLQYVLEEIEPFGEIPS